MTETPSTPADSTARKRGGLSSMLLADLKAMAQGMGIAGASAMRKAQLVEAIKAAQSGHSKEVQQPKQDQQPKQRDPKNPQKQQGQQQKQGSKDQQGQQKQQQGQQGPKDQQNQQNQGQQKQQAQQGPKDQQNQQGQDDDGGGSRRNRRRRGRDRDRRGRGEPDTTVLEDDVLVPAAGILDVLDNYAFVRTSGYLPGSDDVYLSLSMVRKYGLRRGDALVGQVRQPREGERKEKFNPMVRIDSVNGADPDVAQERPDFSAATPVHPAERLRLETSPDELTGRVIDLVAPVGKGQRGLVVAPRRAGRTTALRTVAEAISRNHPECHLMVVLVDERPEEVTDFQRSVKGEVIASTFDRPAADHTSVAELAIERAKRLVELGHDVVVLLDSITGLGRAHNVSGPGSGRVLAGGVDSSALHPPKKFFGAARNVEDGGSLTILATALVETGSRTDEVIFEELQGTANMELWLRRDLADRHLFPAVDVVASGTRREELVLGEGEQQLVRKLRGALAGLGEERAVELLVERLHGSRTNVELLTQVQKDS